MRIPLSLLLVLCSIGFARPLSFSGEAKQKAHAFVEQAFTAESLLSAKVAKGYLAEVLEMDWLAKNQAPLEKALIALLLTDKGRELVKEILPLYLGRRLFFESSHTARAIELSGEAGVAGFNTGGVVYLDELMPFLAVVGTLYHELIHVRDSLRDPKGVGVKALQEAEAFTRNLQKSPITAEGREAVRRLKQSVAPYLIEREVRAYREADHFFSELIAMDSSVLGQVQDLVKLRHWFSYPMEDSDLRLLLTHSSGMGLSEVLVDAYLKAHPKQR